MDQLNNASLNQNRRRFMVALIMCGDIVALVGALVLAFSLRYDFPSIVYLFKTYIQQHMLSITLSIGLYIAFFASFKLYRHAWRFSGMETLWEVVFANSAGLSCMYLTHKLIDGESISASILVIYWMSSIALVGGMRVCLRLLSLGKNYGRHLIQLLHHDNSVKRVVIMGGGVDGARLLDSLFLTAKTAYKVIGFLDDSLNKKGTLIRNVAVLGPLSQIHSLLERNAVDEVIVALPEASGEDIREYVLACRKKKVAVKVVPVLSDMLNGKVFSAFEEISVEDLLRRQPVRINSASIDNSIAGKRVLITGAGGSIGSELARQVLARNPKQLILLGHGENSIHKIYQELRYKRPDMTDRMEMVIVSVSEEAAVDSVFRRFAPQIVFHAAAHKHVPIMETNIIEAVRNNVFGTYNIAKACGTYSVEQMVLISSDKAVYPSSVMGSTKWLCEQVVRAITPIYPHTRYVAVRFGNVLGSRGSVVPIFHEQIKNGGPVTITHQEMTRYFMSIPEAVQLVLQAGAIGESGNLYILDMGKPVKILDLACDMIQLCGYEPYVDIPIEITGLRPGEKLHERLTRYDEEMNPTECAALRAVHHTDRLSEMELHAMLSNFRQLLERGNTNEMRNYLYDLVPELAEYQLFGETQKEAYPAAA